MNYRALFLISGLILSMGFFGLFFSDTNSNSSETEISQTTVAEPQKEQVLVTSATLLRDVKQNTLLQLEDYKLTETTVDVDADLANYNLKDLIQDSQNHSLQGFLVKQSLQAGSLLSAESILSPKDPLFLVSSLDPKQEVAYRIYVRPQNSYILDTLQNGTNASIYSQQQAVGRDSADRTDLVKILDSVQVLNTHTFLPEEQEKNKDIAGYISVKLSSEKAREFYALARDANLIVLPTNQRSSTNHRGTFIRKLRGQ